jgi:hypothetical protein
MPFRPALLGALAALVALTPVAAHADDIFTYSIAGLPGYATIDTPSAPTPISFAPGTSFTVELTGVAAGSPSETADITFYNSGGAGAEGYLFNGPVLFSGTDANPTFLFGNFVLTGIADLGNGPQTVTANLNIAPTPEPASFALVGTAMLSLAGVARRRFTAQR